MAFYSARGGNVGRIYEPQPRPSGLPAFRDVTTRALGEVAGGGGAVCFQRAAEFVWPARRAGGGVLPSRQADILTTVLSNTVQKAPSGMQLSDLVLVKTKDGMLQNVRPFDGGAALLTPDANGEITRIYQITRAGYDGQSISYRDDTSGALNRLRTNGDPATGNSTASKFYEDDGISSVSNTAPARSTDARREIDNDQLAYKPKYSPNINKWQTNGGSITINETGTWTYHDWEGNSASYPDGYPDFKAAGMVKQEVKLNGFISYGRDFAEANRIAPNGPISDKNTWHHCQDLLTMQEINRLMHKRFIHKGGMSLAKHK